MIEVDTSQADAALTRIDAKLTEAAQVTSDMTPLWPRIGQVFAEHQRGIFRSGHDWQPLARATIVRKGSAKVLIETGALMAAATSADPVESSRLVAKFGINHSVVPYAHWHARGAGVPQRSPVPALPPSVKTAMLEVVAERMREALT